MTLRSPRVPAGGPLLEQERPELVAAEGANPPAAKARDWTVKGEIAAKSCSYTHNMRMSHPRTHLQRIGGPDTEDNARVHHLQTGNDCNQEDTDGTAS